MSKLEELVLANTEKLLAMIDKIKPAGEAVITYTGCMLKPSFLVSLVPILGDLRKRNYLVLTDKHLLIIRLKLLRFEYISHEMLPLSRVRVLNAREGLFDKLKLEIPGKVYTFTNVLDQKFITGLKEELDGRKQPKNELIEPS
jgi:hypothetical protein